MSTNNRNGRTAQSTQLTQLLFSFLFGILLTFAALLLFSWLFIQMQIAAYWGVPLATIAVCIGSFVTGHFAAKSLKQNGLFCGLCVGFIFYVVYLVAALLNGQYEFTSLALIKLVCYLLSGAVGGVLGIVVSEKKQTVRRS